MPHRRAAQHPTISFHSTTPTGVIKRRTDDTVTIKATITTQHDPDDLTVEAWTTLGHGETYHAIPLSHTPSNTPEQTFQASLPTPHTGRHKAWIRAKHSDDTRWAWHTTKEEPSLEVHVDPAYVDDAIVYNAFVRYFGAREVQDGGVRRVEPGTFGDIEQHLDRLDDMGVNVLYLNPVHRIGELYKNYNPHDALPSYLQPGCPYSVKDYKSVDPELSFGLEEPDTADHPFEAFRRLVDQAHKRGIRVYMDLVFNHCAHDSVFQRRHPEWFIYKEDPWSLDDPYIHPEGLDDGKPWGDPEHTMSPYDHGDWWEDTAQLNWNNLQDLPRDAFAGEMTGEAHSPDSHPYKRAPNDPPENPTIDTMYEYFTNIVTFWVEEFGIDGFRCDVAYRVPTDFWSQCIDAARRAAKKSHPQNGSVDGDVVFIAEDYHVKNKELLEAGFTACYGDYSNKLSGVNDLTGYLDYMYNISGDHVPDGSKWFLFPECHDFHRNPAKIAQQFRDDHRDVDLNANKSRWTVTATLPGIPMIFNGFEKLEWEPASLFSYSTIDWESDKDISKHITKINQIRHDQPALQDGRYHYIHTDQGIHADTDVFSYARVHDDHPAVIIAVNLNVTDHASTTLHLPDELGFNDDTEYILTELQTDTQYHRSGKDLYVDLPPGEANIFEVTELNT